MAVDVPPGGGPPGAVRVDEEGVRQAIDELNVMMTTHAGRVVLDEIGADGVLQVHFEALCSGCPFRPATMAGTIRPRLMAVEGVTGVEAPGARISAAAEQRFLEMGFGLRAPRTRHHDEHRDEEGDR